MKEKDINIENFDILKEVQDLSKKADLSTNHQLDLFKEDLNDEDIDTIIDLSSISDIANPEKSYRLYYGMRRLLMDNLPKGPENYKLRKYIYSEKGRFLKAGLETGADERQAYIANFLEVAFKVITNWILEGANPYDIFIRFRELNIERGYYNKKEQPQTDFDRKLKKSLDYNPRKDKEKK